METDVQSAKAQLESIIEDMKINFRAGAEYLKEKGTPLPMRDAEHYEFMSLAQMDTVCAIGAAAIKIKNAAKK